MSSKVSDLKEKIKIALTSTAKVISGDFERGANFSENIRSKDLNSIKIDDLQDPGDFIKLRAETDSAALKKKFSIKFFSIPLNIFAPSNSYLVFSAIL